ncbi:MAG: transporter [Arenicellales bacterium]
MYKDLIQARTLTKAVALLLLSSAGSLVSPLANADEGGVSFWLPGQFGSMAAVPGDPGWSLPLIYFHSSVDGEGSREFATAGKITLGLQEDIDLLLAVPTYAFAKPVWGGQLTLSVAGIYGSVDVGVDATLTDPGGGVQSGSETDSNTAVGDLYPSATLRWNNGVHNSMAYVMAGVPVGNYDVNRLANIGTNHWALDAGGGYTYLNMDTGREFSAVAGLTYNFENPDTNYQNGIDSHLDWAASQFVSEKMHVGLVGYFFYQLTGDSGSGAVLGDFKSQVIGLGPQLGYFFNMGKKQAYFNVKAYWEAEAKYRPEGWNSWVTLSLPL